jgi:hypothetical protein
MNHIEFWPRVSTVRSVGGGASATGARSPHSIWGEKTEEIARDLFLIKMYTGEIWNNLVQASS